MLSCRLIARRLPVWAGQLGSRRLSLGAGAAAVEGALSELKAGPSRHAALSERAVLRLAGEDTLSYLQGLVTNDTSALGGSDSASQYSAMLSPQGRVLHDLVLHRVPDGDGKLAVLADVDAAHAQDLLRVLKRYKLRAKVDISDVSHEYGVRALFGGSEGGSSGGGWRADPRLPALGYRMIFPAGELSVLPGGTLEVGAEEYRRWRAAWGVAEGGQEMAKGEALPLEYNLDALAAVSFSKGCYVGQELTARTHFRGVIRKRVVPVALSGKVVVGTQVSRASGGKPVGTIRAAHDGGVGLAHLRMDPVLAGEPLVATGGEGGGGDGGGAGVGVAVLPAVPPEWWPQEWSAPTEGQ